MFSTWAAEALVIGSNKHSRCLSASPIPQGVGEEDWWKEQRLNYSFANPHNMEVAKNDLGITDVDLISHSLESNQFNMKKHHH